MVAVPVPARSGEVLGVVVLHTVAPREFDEGVLNFLVHTASLVAGAIENARLYEETRLRVDALTNLAELSERIVAVGGREELYQVVTAGVRRLLGCDASQLWLRDGEDGRARAGRRSTRRARCPSRTSSRAPRCATTARRSAPWSRVRSRRAHVPGPAPGAPAGRRQPGRPGAAQRRAHRAPDRREPRARALRGARRRRARHRRGPRARRGLRSRSPPRLHPRPPGGDRRRTRGRGPRSPSASRRGCARSRPARSSTRAATRCAACSRCRPAPRPATSGALRELGAERGRRHRHERRAPRRRRRRRGACARRRTPAPSRGRSPRAAARWPTTGWAPTATSCTSRSTTRRTIGCARRWSACSSTTSAARRSCSGRSSSTSPTAASGPPRRRKLFIHANTLRQRLDRIEKLTGLDLATEDLLSLELAVKLVRLRRAGGAEPPPRS